MGSKKHKLDGLVEVDLGSFNSGSVVEEKSISRTLVWEALVRAGLAFIFVLIFFVTVVCAFWFVDSDNWPNIKELLQVLLPAETALLGSAVGFYFGTRK